MKINLKFSQSHPTWVIKFFCAYSYELIVIQEQLFYLSKAENDIQYSNGIKTIQKVKFFSHKTC